MCRSHTFSPLCMSHAFLYHGMSPLFFFLTWTCPITYSPNSGYLLLLAQGLWWWWLFSVCLGTWRDCLKDVSFLCREPLMLLLTHLPRGTVTPERQRGARLCVCLSPCLSIKLSAFVAITPRCWIFYCFQQSPGT